MASSASIGNPERDSRVARSQPAVVTVELAAYVAITLAALAVRLVELGRWPLLPAEAQTALAAWRTLQGNAWRPNAYVPLLYDAHVAVFWLTQATDVTARLLPALAGAALVWLPYAGRAALGRVGALMAALLLALAPTWVFASRSAEWPILSAAVSGLLIAGLWQHQRTGNARAGRVVAIAAGLGLTAGPGVLTALVGVGAAAAVWRLKPGAVGTSAGRRLRGLASRRDLALMAGTFGLVGSALLTNPDGVAQSVEWAGRWVAELRPGASGLGALYYPATLALLEPLTLVLAVTGAAWGIVRGDGQDVGLALWALMALVLGTALGHRDPTWLLDALLPLVLLAGRGAQRAWDALRPGFTAQDGIAVYGALIVVGFGLVALTRYVHVADDTWRGYAMLTAGALLIAWVAYWLWAGDQGVRVGAVVALMLLTGFTVRTTTALAFQTGRDPREPILREPTSARVRDIEDLLASTAAHRAMDRAALTIEYDPTLGEVVAWTLRDYPLAAPAPVARAGEPSAMVLLRPSTEAAYWPAGYVGQTFRLRETWDWTTAGLPWHERLRWLLFREPVGREGAETIQFWVRPRDLEQ